MVDLGHFHHGIYSGAGVSTFRRITEQPVPATYTERANCFFGIVVGKTASTVFEIGFQIRLSVERILNSLPQTTALVVILQLIQPVPERSQNRRGFLQAVFVPLLCAVAVLPAIPLNGKKLIAIDNSLHEMLEALRIVDKVVVYESVDPEFFRDN